MRVFVYGFRRVANNGIFRILSILFPFLLGLYLIDPDAPIESTLFFVGSKKIREILSDFKVP